MGEQPMRTAPSGFAVFLRVIAVATLIASLVAGQMSEQVMLCLFAGLLVGVGWWSLSYIVDACIKYLDKD